jgi:hypothetical protein
MSGAWSIFDQNRATHKKPRGVDAALDDEELRQCLQPAARPPHSC